MLCVIPEATQGQTTPYNVSASVNYSQTSASPASSTTAVGSIDGTYNGNCSTITVAIPLVVTFTTPGNPPSVGSGSASVTWGTSATLPGGSNFAAIDGRRSVVTLGAGPAGYGSATGAIDQQGDVGWQINFQGATIGSASGSNSSFASGSATVGAPCGLSFSWTANYDDGNVVASATYTVTITNPLLCPSSDSSGCSDCADDEITPA